MNGWCADENEMRCHRDRMSPCDDDDRLAFDELLVDQLLDPAGADSLPASYRLLAEVLAATRGPATEAELVGESEAVALFRLQSSAARVTGTSSRARRRRGPKTFLVVGGLTLMSVTGAAAASGALRQPVQAMA